MGFTEQTIRFPRRLQAVSASGHGRDQKLNDECHTSTAPGGPGVRDEADLGAEPQADEGGQLVVELLESIKQRLDDLEQRRAQSLHEMQQLAMELAVAMTGHLIQARIEEGDTGLEHLAQQAIERLLPHGPVKVALHPSDLQLLAERHAELVAELQAEGHSTFVADKSVPRGGCRADAGEVGVWSTLEQRLSHLREELIQGIDYAQTERRQAEGSGAGLRRFPDRRETA